MTLDEDRLRQMLDAQCESLIQKLDALLMQRIVTLMGEAGIITDTISQSRAYELYGRRTVERWVQRGYLTVNSDGARRRKRYSVVELHKAEKNNNIKSKTKL